MSMDTLNIRKAMSGDLPDVYRLICELENELLNYKNFTTIFNQHLDDPDCVYWVAEDGSKIIGFISLHIQQLLHHCGRVGEVQEFYIDNGYRGKGVGTALMNEAKKYAEAKEVKSFEVTSNKKRVENVKVYERLGFSLTHNKFTI